MSQREKIKRKNNKSLFSGLDEERRTLSLTATDKSYSPVMMCPSVMPPALIGFKLRKQSYLLGFFRSMSIPEGIDRVHLLRLSRDEMEPIRQEEEHC